MRSKIIYLTLLIVLTAALACKREQSTVNPPGIFQLIKIQIGDKTLDLLGANGNISVDSTIQLDFSTTLDTVTAKKSISLVKGADSTFMTNFSFQNENKTVILKHGVALGFQTSYLIRISDGLNGSKGETFPGLTVNFTTEKGVLKIEQITVNGKDFGFQPLRDIDFQNLDIQIQFSHQLDPADYQSAFYLSGNFPKTITLSNDGKEVNIVNTSDLEYYQHYDFAISENLTAKNGFTFSGYQNSFYTRLDSTLKFPIISDDELLTLVQQKTFDYFYSFAHPNCGLARERNTSGDIVTIGGSGFGMMALIVGMDRGFITHAEGLTRLEKILDFLETCDRFHGAWPHWLNGNTGKVHPFSPNDDGADLVETSYLVEGLYTMRQYLDPDVPEQQQQIDRINALIDGVEWDWFTRGENVLYWHWSPNVGWAMNMKIQGYNETLITYIMAASSTTHGIDATVYHEGYAKNGAIQNGGTFYGYTLPLGYGMGGPLFFTHYSFLGLDPRNLQDMYASYWEQNVNQSLINWAYCVDNPKNWIGYGTACWGLTASDNPEGYNAQSPSNDLGVITPTAAVSALPYTPEQSMDAIHHFYYILGDRLWGEYGFYDAFDVSASWWADSYLAIDEGPIVCMIENYRSQLLWNLFMSCPEVQNGLTDLGFSY